MLKSDWDFLDTTGAVSKTYEHTMSGTKQFKTPKNNFNGTKQLKTSKNNLVHVVEEQFFSAFLLPKNFSSFFFFFVLCTVCHHDLDFSFQKSGWFSLRKVGSTRAA